MIDYKYPTIASGATPIRSAGRAPDEELLREERGRKFRVHCRWQAPENKLDIFTPIGRADSRTQRFQEVEELKSKIQEVED
jgi:hypothetical protein